MSEKPAFYLKILIESELSKLLEAQIFVFTNYYEIYEEIIFSILHHAAIAKQKCLFLFTPKTNVNRKISFLETKKNYIFLTNLHENKKLLIRESPVSWTPWSRESPRCPGHRGVVFLVFAVFFKLQPIDTAFKTTIYQKTV